MRFIPAAAMMLLAATADHPPKRVARTATPWRNDPPEPKAPTVRAADLVPPPKPRPASRQVGRANARREEFAAIRDNPDYIGCTRQDIRYMARVRVRRPRAVSC